MTHPGSGGSKTPVSGGGRRAALWRALAALFLVWLVGSSWDTYRYVVAPPRFEFDPDASPNALDELDTLDELEMLDELDSLDYLSDPDVLDDPAVLHDPAPLNDLGVLDGSRDSNAPTELGSPAAEDLEAGADAWLDGESQWLDALPTNQDRSAPGSGSDLVLAEGESHAPRSIDDLREQIRQRSDRDRAFREEVAQEDEDQADDNPLDAMLEELADDRLAEASAQVTPELRLVREDDFLPRMVALSLLQLLIGLLLLAVARGERRGLISPAAVLVIATGSVGLALALLEGTPAAEWLMAVPTRPFPVLACALLAWPIARWGRRAGLVLSLTYGLTAVATVERWGPEPHWLGGGLVFLAALAVGLLACVRLGARAANEQDAPSEGPFRTAAATAREEPAQPVDARALTWAVILMVPLQLFGLRMSLGLTAEPFAYEGASVALAGLVAVGIAIGRAAVGAPARERHPWRLTARALGGLALLQLLWITWQASLVREGFRLAYESTAYTFVFGLGIGLPLVFFLRALQHSATESAPPEQTQPAATPVESIGVMFGAVGLSGLAFLLGASSPWDDALVEIAACATAAAVGAWTFVKLTLRYLAQRGEDAEA